LPVILTSIHYRSGFVSVLYVGGMMVIGILLFLASIQSLRVCLRIRFELHFGLFSGKNLAELTCVEHQPPLREIFCHTK